jgi:hypothetical protein
MGWFYKKKIILKIINMENLRELNAKELYQINGGHNGTAYDIGETIGGWFRDAVDEIVVNWGLRKLKLIK